MQLPSQEGPMSGRDWAVMGGCMFQGRQTGLITGENGQPAQKWGDIASPNSSFSFLSITEGWSPPLRWGNIVAPIIQDGHVVFPTSITFQNFCSKTDWHLVQRRQRMSQKLCGYGDLVWNCYMLRLSCPLNWMTGTVY